MDGTLGGAGHARMILQKLGKEGKLFGFEWDERNFQFARGNLQEFENATLFNENFANMLEFVPESLHGKFNGVLLDFGVSSMHLDDAGRGFSFLQSGPLDMRFSMGNPLSAFDVVNNFPEKKLAGIFKDFGEERFARRIASHLCKQRKVEKFRTTTQLADFIAGVVPKNFKNKNHPATLCFQALRIFVNSELDNIAQGLQAGVTLLKKSGRIAAISFHSLEDRIVKNFFRNVSRVCTCPKELLKCRCGGVQKFKILTRKPVMASAEEIARNPRARSAKLRVIEKII